MDKIFIWIKYYPFMNVAALSCFFYYNSESLHLFPTYVPLSSNMYMFIKLHDRRGRVARYFRASSGVRDKWLLILAMPIIISVMAIQKVRNSLLYVLLSNTAPAFAIPALVVSLPALQLQTIGGSTFIVSLGPSLSQLTYVLSSQAGNKEAVLWFALLRFIEMLHFVYFHFCTLYFTKILISYI